MSISRQQVEAVQQVPKTSTKRRRNGNDIDDDEEVGVEESQYSHPLIKKAEAAVVVRYRECQKNHAASMGGNARDGCGEFMPSGEEGTIEALKCSACYCHRNFHRKETQEEVYFSKYMYYNKPMTVTGTIKYPTAGTLLVSSSSRMTLTAPQVQNMTILGSIPSVQSDGQQQEDIIINGGSGGGGGGGGIKPLPISNEKKKRFRTKFTQEQKEKMLRFAERSDWRIQKQEESVIQQFCQEIGIRRRVLKVWMHNNKHNLALARTNPSSTH